jgi:type II secretory pathway pseudopilin PulG
LALNQIRRNEAGFTLVESVVAMGLFVGVVFLLVSVFNEFMMDSFVVKSNKALVIAENEASSVERTKGFDGVARDTVGFHIIRTVVLKDKVAFVDVTVESVSRDTQPAADAPMAPKKPRTIYINLSKVIPIR